MFETCFKDKLKHYLNPIIDWQDDDVWEFIKSKGMKYCCLYDEGYKRIGCIMCPMARKAREKDIIRYPKYYNAYLKAFGKMIDERKKRGLDCEWETGEEVMEWWLSDIHIKVDPDQTNIFEQ